MLVDLINHFNVSTSLGIEESELNFQLADTRSEIFPNCKQKYGKRIETAMFTKKVWNLTEHNLKDHKD